MSKNVGRVCRAEGVPVKIAVCVEHVPDTWADKGRRSGNSGVVRDLFTVVPQLTNATAKRAD